MLIATAVALSVIIFTLSVKPAHAIIVIVPTVLIPIVSIVIWIIGAITAPIVGLTALYFKMKNRSLVKGVFAGIFILIMVGIIMTIIFKLTNPDRPIY